MNKTASSILPLISAILKALQSVPVIGADAAVAGVFVSLLQTSLAAFEAANGAPLDLTKIPLETPVP